MHVRVGTSGWSYPSWRPGFYPAGTQPHEFLGVYARRFDTVELNTTGYRLPAADQFRRWAEAVPDGFLFAPKLVLGSPGRFEAALGRLAALGDRLGPVRVLVECARDERLLARVLEAAAGVELAFDLRHPSWRRADVSVAVGDEHPSPFAYVRLREPPYGEEDLRALAERLHPPAYVYFRHEDTPTAPAYAGRLLELLSAGRSPA